MNPRRPLSVWVFGLSTSLVSVVMVLSELFNLLSEQALAGMGLDVNLLTRMVPREYQSLLDLYEYSRYTSYFNIFYFAAILVASVMFIQLRRLGRTILEIAAWVGLVDGLIEAIVGYLIMQRLQASMAAMMSGIGAGGYSFQLPVGLAATIFGLALWFIPSVSCLVYLRRRAVREIMIR